MVVLVRDLYMMSAFVYALHISQRFEQLNVRQGNQIGTSYMRHYVEKTQMIFGRRGAGCIINLNVTYLLS